MDRDIDYRQNHITYGDAVENIQKYLRRLSHSEPTIPTVPIDGIYDSITRDAVSEFQALSGIERSGIVDRDTHNALYARYLSESDSDSEVLDIFISPAMWQRFTLRQGNTHPPVLVLQAFLGELSLIYDGIAPITMSGIYDEDTELSVRAIQRAHLLPEDGITDKATWLAILRAYKAYSDTFE